MTIVYWLAMNRREVTGVCWNCDATQTRAGWVGYGLPFYCSACEVSWSVKVPKE